MTKQIPISKERIYLAVLTILNFLTNMTQTELDIIATMLNNEFKVLTKRRRSSLSTLLNKDKYTINNHIKRLKEKGVFVINEDRWLEINPNLVSTINKVINDREITLELNVS